MPANTADWNSHSRVQASEKWRSQSAAMGNGFTQAIVESARISPGLRVLDIACGTGEPGIWIATLLKDTGEVIGIDLAPGALKTAEERAQKRGLTNIRFQHADAHDLPFANESYDRITSRLGVMFFADLPRALREMHRVLKPGGRLALLTWGPMKQPYFESTVGTVLRMLPGGAIRESDVAMFAFAEPGVLTQKLQQAGFAQVEENFVTLPWTWPGTPQECWDYFQEVTVPFAPLLRSIPQDERPAIDAEVLQAISKYYNGHEINFTATANICCAVK